MQTIRVICLVLLLFGILNPARALKEEWKNAILDIHNSLRKNITACLVRGQPSAVNMPMLKWHDGLERTAQNWANQCQMGHDKPEQAEFFAVGQNWAGAGGVEEGVHLWIDEYKDYDFRSNFCRTGMCGHYTQMVWAKSTYIGCGVSSCSPWGYGIVCNYGPAGNIVSQSPYEESTNCRSITEDQEHNTPYTGVPVQPESVLATEPPPIQSENQPNLNGQASYNYQPQYQQSGQWPNQYQQSGQWPSQYQPSGQWPSQYQPSGQWPNQYQPSSQWSNYKKPNYQPMYNDQSYWSRQGQNFLKNED